MPNIDDLLTTAKNEVGYLEKRSNKQLYDKVANAGKANYTKYWAELKPSWQGQPWCMCFVSWCFNKTFGTEEAKRLLCCNSDFSYSCTTTYNRFKTKGWIYFTPQVGDLILFNESVGSKTMSHVGLVWRVDEDRVYTIEGNTTTGTSVVANGGGVVYKSYTKNYNRIGGFARPQYKSAVKKPISTVAIEVIDGKWGNGEERKKRLTDAGYDPKEVQAEVNKMWKSR